ncbi:MAG: hypothetical protein ACREMA_19060, partial [Longimicrobiales bacterium]
IAGGQMHLRRSGQLLEVAIRTSPLMVASLCLATNDQVRVLHASAALGSVTYSKIGEAYETNQSFEWRMRETALDSVTRSQRSEHFERERWVANTLRMGTPGQVEFRIQLDSDQTETRIALGLMKLESLGRVTAWPERAAGACADAQLVSGSAPRIVAFRPNEWPVIPGAAPR